MAPSAASAFLALTASKIRACASYPRSSSAGSNSAISRCCRSQARGYAGRRTVANLNKSSPLQRNERVANGRAAYTKASTEVPLGRAIDRQVLKHRPKFLSECGQRPAQTAFAALSLTVAFHPFIQSPLLLIMLSYQQIEDNRPCFAPVGT